MAIEGLRKHSTTLFKGVLSGTQTRYATLLPAHTNLTNHQLCMAADQTLTGGIYKVKIIPDTDGANMTVDTGLVLDLTDRDSAMVTFTGVIRGIYLEAVELIPEIDARLYAVLSSFSRYKRTSIEDNRQERLDYVSSDIAVSTDAGFNSLAKLTPNNSNLIYHQISLSATEAQADTYEIRIIPDADVTLPTTVATGIQVVFDGKADTVVRFGAVLRGIELRAVELFPQPPTGAAKMDIVLSSSVERFDELVYDYIGIPVNIDDHISDFDNPHQTSWDNLLNKPTAWLNKNYLFSGESLLVPEYHQFLVWEQYFNEGSLAVQGTMVILNELPTSRAREPDFTYNLSGNLTQIDYAEGQQKLFTYNGSDQLTQVDSTRDGSTLRKSFFYTGGGELDYITEEWI